MSVKQTTIKDKVKEKAAYANASMAITKIVKDKQKELESSTNTVAFEYIIKNFDLYEKIKKPRFNNDANAIILITDDVKEIIKNSSISENDRYIINQNLDNIKYYSEDIKKINEDTFMPSFPNLICTNKNE